MLGGRSDAAQVRQAILSSLAHFVPRTGEETLPAKPSRYNVIIPLSAGRALVYNSFSTAFSVWDAADVAVYEKVKQGLLPICDSEIQPFLKGGYVVGAHTDELDEVRRHYEANRFDPARMIMTIAPTLGCNFACNYCFQGLDKPTERMAPEVKQALLAYLERKTKELRHLHVAWYGGEPLMDRKSVYELSDGIIEICKRNNTSYSAFIVTNGYFLDGATAKALYERKVTTSQVTLDGPAELHDRRRYLTSGKPTYERILNNLAEVMATVPLDVSIRVNVDTTNKDDVCRLMDDLSARGLAGRRNFRIYFAPVEAITEECHDCNMDAMRKAEYGKLEADLYRYAFERRLSPLPKAPLYHGTCQAVRPNGILVTPDGDLHKCWDTVMNKELRVGTIFDAEAVAASPINKAWLAWTPFENSTCRSCPIMPTCAGACAFKFVHAERTLGEGGSLPCPSWKFNMAERLFLRAEKMGLVKAEDWIKGVGDDHPQTTGQRHTFELMQKARQRVSA